MIPNYFLPKFKTLDNRYYIPITTKKYYFPLETPITDILHCLCP